MPISTACSAQQLLGVLDEKRAPDDMSGYDRMVMEPLVFARLAGFIAAHVPLSEDPLRRVIDALMVGYSEGESRPGPRS